MKKFLVILLILGGLVGANQEEEANIKGFCFSYMSEYDSPGYYLGYRINNNLEILGGYSTSKYDDKEDTESYYRKEVSEEKTELYGIKYYYLNKENLHLYLGAFTIKGTETYEYESNYSYANKDIEKSSFTGNKFCLGAQYFINSNYFAFNIEYGVVNQNLKGTQEDENKIEKDIKNDTHHSYSAMGISCYF